MGNAPSTSPPQPTMKITKPKTNRNSSDLLKATFRPAQESGLSSSPATGDGLLAPATGPYTPPQRHARPRLRTQLLSIANLSAHDDDHSSNSPHSTKASSRDRPSRSASLISRVSSNRCSTMRLSVLCDTRPTGALDSDYGSSPGGARPLEALKEHDLADDATSTSHDPEAWHRPRFEKPVIYATRRRSMFTPGVATRGSTGYDGFVMDPVAEDLPIAEAYSNYDPQSAPLFGLDLPGGFISPLADQRASTPSDINYQLGCLKRGTLHITNGAASPVSSLHSGGYFSSAIETARSQAERLPSEAIFGNDPFYGDWVGVNPAAPPAVVAWADPASRPASNPQLRKRGHRLGLEMQRSCHPYLSHERLVRSSSVAALVDEANATTMRSFGASENALPPIVKEYQSVVPPSPYISDVDAPADNDTAAAHEDSFDDEGIVASPIEPPDEYSQPEETAAMAFYPDSPGEDLQVTPTDQDQDWPLRNTSLDESFGSSRPSSSHLTSPQPMGTAEPVTKLAKTDSGYSSSTSLRSLHGARRSDTEGTLPVIFSRPASSIYTQEILSLPAVPLKIPPPVPPKAASSSPSSPGILEGEKGPAVPPKSYASFQQADARPPPISKSALPEVEASRPEPPPKDAVWAHQEEIRVSEKPLPPAAPNKLHKPLPRARSQERVSLTVQGVLVAKPQPVPAVPSEMATRHFERLERLPGGPVSAADPERSLVTASGPSMAHISFPQSAGEEQHADAAATRKRRRPSLTAVLPSFALHTKSGTATPAEILIDDDDIAPQGCLDAVCLGMSPYDAAVSPSRLEPHVRNQDKPFMRQLRRVYKAKSMADLHSKVAVGSELRAESKGAASSSGAKRLPLHHPRPHSFCSLLDAADEPASEAVDEGCRVSQPPAPEWPPPVPSLPDKLLRSQNGRGGATVAAAATQYVNLLGPPKPPAKPGCIINNNNNNVSLADASYRPAMSEGCGGRLQDAFRRKREGMSPFSALELSSTTYPLASTSASEAGLLSRRKPVAAAAAAAAAETARLPLLHQNHELNRRRHMAISVQT